MSKTIFEMVKENPDYQNALSVAPESDRENVEKVIEKFTSTLQTFASMLEIISRDPEKTAEFRQEIERAIRANPGVTRGS